MSLIHLSKDFFNQSIILPYMDNFYYQMTGTTNEYPVIMEEICPLEENERYLFGIWVYILFYLVCFCVGLFSFRLCRYLFWLGEDEQTGDVVDEMKKLISEIAELSEEKRYELSERYYILTNMLANKFRIHVYEKILK